MSHPAKHWYLAPQAKAIIAGLRYAEFARHGETFIPLTDRADRRLVRLDAMRAGAIRTTGCGEDVPTLYEVLADEFAVRAAETAFCA